MEHKWFKDLLRQSQVERKAQAHEEDSAILKSLKAYKRRSTLKNAAVNILVKHMDSKELANLRAAFEKIDVDGSGFIEIEELRMAMSNADNLHSKEEL